MTSISLLARLREAKGADRNLDAMIHHHVTNGIGCGYTQDAPRYTESLDAVMTLIPEGWTAIELRSRGGLTRWVVELSRIRDDTEEYADGHASTPALALLIAIFEARTAMELE